MIFEKLINFIDKNYHHKRVIKFLSNYKIDLIIDVGSHKGEFLKISIRDSQGASTVVLGNILKTDLKRVAKSL